MFGLGMRLCRIYALPHSVLLSPPPSPSLPVRCGSGLSGEVLTEAGHHWVGIDVSQHMLGEGVFYWRHILF